LVDEQSSADWKNIAFYSAELQSNLPHAAFDAADIKSNPPHAGLTFHSCAQTPTPHPPYAVWHTHAMLIGRRAALAEG
jgi:hypothetical protein